MRRFAAGGAQPDRTGDGRRIDRCFCRLCRPDHPAGRGRVRFIESWTLMRTGAKQWRRHAGAFRDIRGIPMSGTLRYGAGYAPAAA